MKKTKIRYTPPQLYQMDATDNNAIGDCNTGAANSSGAICYSTGPSASIVCDTTGNTATTTCISTGGSAAGTCTGTGASF